MKNIDNQKVTLTGKQLKELIEESSGKKISENWLTRQVGKLFGGGNQSSPAPAGTPAAATPPPLPATPPPLPANASGAAPATPSEPEGNKNDAAGAAAAATADKTPDDKPPEAKGSDAIDMSQIDSKGTIAGMKICKWLTPVDVAGAVTAGIVAYLRNDPQAAQEDPATENFNSVQDEFAKFQASGHASKISGGWIATDDNGAPVAVFKTIQGGGIEKFSLGADGQITGGTYFSPDGNTLSLSMNNTHALRAQNSLNLFGKSQQLGGVGAQNVARAQSSLTGAAKMLASAPRDPSMYANPGGKAFDPSTMFVGTSSPTTAVAKGASSLWKPDGSFNISAVHWKSVPGRGMLPFGPDKQPLTGKAFAAAEQLHKQAAASIRASMA